MLLVFAAIGCRQDMHDQPKFVPQRGTNLFADGRSSRPQVVNTIARNQAVEPGYFLTGSIDGKEADGFPMPLTPQVMARGQERYNVYCTPCHSRVGNGLGMIVQRGYQTAGNFHTARLRQAPLGHLFAVITNGYGTMPDYAAQITPEDRWAIVAYIRALQLSQSAPTADAPQGAKPEPLKQVALQLNMPAEFADRWAATKAAAPAPVVATQPMLTPAAEQPEKAMTTSDSTKTTGQQSSNEPGPVKPAKLKASAGDPVAGKELYEQRCQACHKKDLGGRPPNIPGLIGVVEKSGGGHVRTVITEGIPAGHPPMPANPDFSPADLSNLIVFLQSPQ